MACAAMKKRRRAIGLMENHIGKNACVIAEAHVPKNVGRTFPPVANWRFSTGCRVRKKTSITEATEGK
jgi:hypothetical protein